MIMNIKFAINLWQIILTPYTNQLSFLELGASPLCSLREQKTPTKELTRKIIVKNIPGGKYIFPKM